MNEYEKQAKDFLKATSTTLKIEFEGYKSHFVDEEQKRNVYKVTLTNQRGEYVFKFGDSINNYEKCLKPTTYDVLACLSGYEPEDYKDFCDSYGYEAEENKSEEIYHLVLKEWEGLTQIFTLEELELLSEVV